MRADLKMRKGKIAAQAAHASMAVFTKFINSEYLKAHYEYEFSFKLDSSQGKVLNEWFENSFKKVCVYVDSEQELVDIYNKAKEKGMLCSLITDNGATEFKGVPTITCCAIGPDYDEEFIGITDKLPLY